MAYWLTDDRAVFDYASRRGMLAQTTVDVVRAAVANGDLRTDTGYAMLTSIQLAGRYVHRMPTAAADLAR